MRLTYSRTLLSRWQSTSHSRLLFSRFSNRGANTQSLPDSGSPAFNFSMACALNSSKSNELLIITVKTIISLLDIL